MTMDDTLPTSDAELVVDHLSADSFGASGRRELLQYRDLGLDRSTSGRLRATMMRATSEPETTGWHYHQCDVQFIYVVEGWVELAFEDGRVERLEKGSAMTIPGGTVHNEVAMADDFELLEVCTPADMGTVAVDPPS